MALQVFLAMPCGHQQDIDFDAVYAEVLKPALADAGFEVFRADQEQRAGDIRADMFQELLLADLVVVDLTLDRPARRAWTLLWPCLTKSWPAVKNPGKRAGCSCSAAT